MVDAESAQLTAAQVQQMSEIMLNGMKSQVLPSVMTEFTNWCTGEILPKMKNDFLLAAEKLVADATNELRQHVQRKQYTPEDAMKFMQDHKETFNKHEGIRDDAYWKATRYYEIVKLYEQVLNESPVYVPRKFRRDKYHIMSAAELEILQRREVNELKSEIEVFKLREERNRKKVELQDDLVTIFVNENVQNPYLKEAILRSWNDKNRNEMERVTRVWHGKIEGVKKAFDKDKEFIRRHNETRVKQRETDGTRRVENPVGEGVSPSSSAEGTENIRNEAAEAESEQPEESQVIELGSVVNEDAAENIGNNANIDETPEVVETEEPNTTPQANVISDTPRSSNTVNDMSSRSSEAPSSSQQRTIIRSAVLEDVESDENFTDEELSQVLFEETMDVRNRDNLVALVSDTSEDEADDEANENQSDFQNTYNLRKKLRKPRNSYSPQVASKPPESRRQQQEQQQQQQQHQQQEHQEQQQQQRQQQQQQRRKTPRQKSSTSRGKTFHGRR